MKRDTYLRAYRPLGILKIHLDQCFCMRAQLIDNMLALTAGLREEKEEDSKLL